MYQNIMSKCVNIKITQIFYIHFFLIKSSNLECILGLQCIQIGLATLQGTTGHKC